MSEIVKIGKRYTIVIPKAFRQKLHLKEGQLSETRLEDGKIIITPKTSNPFQSLKELIEMSFTTRKPRGEQRSSYLIEVSKACTKLLCQ